LTLGAAAHQPPGTSFIWITGVLGLVVTLVAVLLAAFGLDTVLFPSRAFLNWALLVTLLNCILLIGFIDFVKPN
jgi:hypothetical protein